MSMACRYPEALTALVATSLPSAEAYETPYTEPVEPEGEPQEGCTSLPVFYRFLSEHSSVQHALKDQVALKDTLARLDWTAAWALAQSACPELALEYSAELVRAGSSGDIIAPATAMGGGGSGGGGQEVDPKVLKQIEILSKKKAAIKTLPLTLTLTLSSLTLSEGVSDSNPNWKAASGLNDAQEVMLAKLIASVPCAPGSGEREAGMKERVANPDRHLETIRNRLVAQLVAEEVERSLQEGDEKGDPREVVEAKCCRVLPLVLTK